MKPKAFKSIMELLAGDAGQELFEEEIQYMGYIFVDMTDRQLSELGSFLNEAYGYPIAERGGRQMVLFPNGLGVKVEK